MRLTASASVPMHNLPINEVILAAFNSAWRMFEMEHGRSPDIDILDFRGGFSTTNLVLEITEDP